VTDQQDTTFKTGHVLKDARQAQNLTLEKISQTLRIRKEYLEALEDHSIDKFPERVYIMGYVRNYAKLLKLDETKILQDFALEMKEVESKESNTVYPVHVNESQVPSKFVAYFTFIVFIGLFFLAYSYMNHIHANDMFSYDLDAFIDESLKDS